jgi:hypothetical protein
MTTSGVKILMAALATLAVTLPASAEDGARRGAPHRHGTVATAARVAPATPTSATASAAASRQPEWTCRSVICSRYILIGLSF